MSKLNVGQWFSLRDPSRTEINLSQSPIFLRELKSYLSLDIMLTYIQRFMPSNIPLSNLRGVALEGKGNISLSEELLFTRINLQRCILKAKNAL